MYNIYIDTTKRFEKKVKLVKGVDSKEVTVEKVTGDIDIATTIKNILDKHNVTQDQIVEVIPNTGPGSFTGIKTGVTIANIINWANGKKSINELYQPQYGQEPNITPRKST